MGIPVSCAGSNLGHDAIDHRQAPCYAGAAMLDRVAGYWRCVCAVWNCHHVFRRSTRRAVVLPCPCVELLSFVGIVVLFRGELPVDGLGALGDWMALLAGICWSLGSALMFSSSSIDIRSMSYASFISAIIVSVACLILFGGHAEMLATIDMQSLSMTIVVLGLIGILYLLPVTLVTLWGATVIPPAMMSFLLTLEVIAAVASGAIFLDVRFGLVELLGTTLIIGGALTEVLRVRSQR